MDKSEFLGKEIVGKLILKFSIPCVLSLLLSAALAAILGQIVTAILGIVYLFRPKTYTNSWKILSQICLPY